MPKLTPGARTTDMTAQAATMRRDGFMTRVVGSVRYAITGVSPQSWMSPNQPIDPQAQDQAYGRRLDYPVGYNLVYTPRGGEATPFWQLRALADSHDLTRLCIETRKDQMVKLKWAIGPIDPAVDKDARSASIEALFRHPDGRNTWQGWLRQLMEEVLVTDAPAILPRKRNDGTMYGFDLIDGALIKVLSDAEGRAPLPPSPAYQQVIKGLPAVDYTSDELVYMPRNPRVSKFYGFGPVEQIMMIVNIGLRRQFSQLQYFTEGSIPEAFASVPKDWTPQQIEQFQTYWDSVVLGDQAIKRQVRFVPGETKVTLLKEQALMDVFDEWIARVVTYAFSLPPTQFSKQETRTTSDELQEAALAEGLAPMMVWVKDLMDYLIHKYLGADDLEFRWDQEEALDPQSQQVVLTNYQKQGNLTVNEVRAKLGYDPVPDGDEALIYTAAGAVTLASVKEPPAAAPTFHPSMAPDQGANPPADASGDVGDPAVKLAKGAEAMTPVMRKLSSSLEAAFGMMSDQAVKGVRKASSTDDTHHPAADAGWSGFADSFDTSPLSLVWDDLNGTLSAVAVSGAQAQIMQVIAEGEITQPEAEAAITGGVQPLTPEAMQTAIESGTPAKVPVDLLNYRDPDAVEWAQQHAAELITKDGTGGELADATRNMLRRTLTQALQDKLGDHEIEALLRSDYAFSPARAELIARTEVRNATGNGRLVGAQRVGMKYKNWLLSNDDNPCPICVGNAAQGYIQIEKPFEGGTMSAPQHPRCRCSSTYTNHAHT